MRQSTSITGCVRRSVGRSVSVVRPVNAIVRRSTRRTLLAYLALFYYLWVLSTKIELYRDFVLFEMVPAQCSISRTCDSRTVSVRWSIGLLVCCSVCWSVAPLVCCSVPELKCWLFFALVPLPIPPRLGGGYTAFIWILSNLTQVWKLIIWLLFN